MSLRRPFLLLLTCAAALSACGGDDRLSAEDYRAQGNAACAQYEKDVRAIAQPSSIEGVSAYAEKAQAELVELIDELDALVPPDDLEQKHNQLVKLGRESTDALGALSDAGETGKQAEIEKALAGAAELDTQSDELSRTLGLNECADQS